MPQPIYVPAHVKQAIVRHIETAAASAVTAYGSAEEEEDALTGQFGFPGAAEKSAACVD